MPISPEPNYSRFTNGDILKLSDKNCYEIFLMEGLIELGAVFEETVFVEHGLTSCSFYRFLFFFVF